MGTYFKLDGLQMGRLVGLEEGKRREGLICPPGTSNVVLGDGCAIVLEGLLKVATGPGHPRKALFKGPVFLSTKLGAASR